MANDFEMMATYNTTGLLFDGTFGKDTPEAIGNALYTLACQAIAGIEAKKFELALSLSRLEAQIVDVAKNVVYQRLGFTDITTLCECKLNIGRTQAYKYCNVGKLIEQNKDADGNAMPFKDADGKVFNFEAHAQLFRVFNKKGLDALKANIANKRYLATETVATITDTVNEELNTVTLPDGTVVTNANANGKGTPKKHNKGKGKDTPDKPQGNAQDTPDKPQGNAQDTPDKPQGNAQDNTQDTPDKPNDKGVSFILRACDGKLYSVTVPTSVYNKYIKDAIYTPDASKLYTPEDTPDKAQDTPDKAQDTPAKKGKGKAKKTA